MSHRGGDHREPQCISHGIPVPRAWFIHGAFDGNGQRHIDWLGPYFEERGYRAKTGFDYGWTGTLLAWVGFNRRWARLLAGQIRPGDVGVGHSNGCAILKLAADYGAPFRELVLLHPALDRDTEFAPQLKYIHVYHSPTELPTAIARFIPFHMWGDMGRVGYKGKDSRVINIDVASAKDFPVGGHTGEARNPEFWGTQIASGVAMAPLSVYPEYSERRLS